MTEKLANKPNSSRKPKVRRGEPTHGEISRRAYFIHLQEGEMRSARRLAARGAQAGDG